MKLVSLTIARNSGWCIKATIAHALKYCDAAVVLLHSTTDDSLKILRRFDRRVTIAKLDDPEWNEMNHRQQTLEIGRDLGGTHFVILDDDEMLTENLVPKIRDIADQQIEAQCVSLPWLSLWRSLDQYRVDAGHPLGRAYKTVLFRDGSDVSWKPTAGYHHHHTQPFNTDLIRLYNHDQGGWFHFQHANWERLVAKQRWYMHMEMYRWGTIRANYKGTMDETGLKLADVPPAWWGKERKWIKLEGDSWHAAEIERMRAEKGAAFFEGL